MCAMVLEAHVIVIMLTMDEGGALNPPLDHTFFRDTMVPLTGCKSSKIDDPAKHPL